MPSMEVDYATHYPWAKEEVIKARSMYYDWPSLERVRDDFVLTIDGYDENVIIKPCLVSELAYTDTDTDTDKGMRIILCYIFEIVLSKLGIRFPLTEFESGMLLMLNVASTQLHPNSWAFVKVFLLPCKIFGLTLTITPMKGF